MFAHDMKLFQEGLDILREAIILQTHDYDLVPADWGVEICGLNKEQADTMLEWLDRFAEGKHAAASDH